MLIGANEEQLMRAHAILNQQHQLQMNQSRDIIRMLSAGRQFNVPDESSVRHFNASNDFLGRQFNVPEDVPTHSSSSNNKKMAESFPDKLHRILEDAENEGNSHIISFFAQGRAFRVHDPDTFVTDIMPRYFTTSRFSSFQRQLNLYGFRRIVEGNTSGFCHELFLRGQKELAAQIFRKKQRVPGGSEDDAETARRLEERLKGSADDSSIISYGSASYGSTSSTSKRMSLADARQQLSNVRLLLASSMPPPQPGQQQEQNCDASE
jgi:HSF-type DNA-binding